MADASSGLAGASRRLSAAWGVASAAALIFALNLGTRQSMGLFLGDLNTSTGLGLVGVSLAFAVSQIAWGLAQPFAGAAADRYGAAPVVALGCVLVALGTWLTPRMDSVAGLVVAIGILGAVGSGMAGPAVLMSATARLLPAGKVGAANAVVNAGGSLGQFVMAPVAGLLIAGLGWAAAMQALGLLVLAALPAVPVLRGSARPAAAAPAAATVPLTAREALRRARAVPDYWLLNAGFFICGFHIAFLSTHLPGVVAQCGLPPRVAAWSLGVLGLSNVAGSLAMGWAVGRWRMKSLLALVYATRGVAVLLFLAAPKTEAVLLAFAAVMGATFLATVPPTAGLVARLFGPANMAMLFGIVMLSHQAGGFLGAWLGAQAFVATGSYDALWKADALLAFTAALLHLPIREAPPRVAAA